MLLVKLKGYFSLIVPEYRNLISFQAELQASERAFPVLHFSDRDDGIRFKKKRDISCGRVLLGLSEQLLAVMYKCVTAGHFNL